MNEKNARNVGVEKMYTTDKFTYLRFFHRIAERSGASFSILLLFRF